MANAQRDHNIQRSGDTMMVTMTPYSTDGRGETTVMYFSECCASCAFDRAFQHPDSGVSVALMRTGSGIEGLDVTVRALMYADPATAASVYLTQAMSADRELHELVAQFERLCPYDDGVWTCDGGAPFAAYLADLRGFTRRLRSGVFWHATADSYNAAAGCEPGSDGWADCRDEAHCWVEIDRPYGTVILDPNGERITGSPAPRLVLLDACTHMVCGPDGRWRPSPYEPVNDSERDCIGYMPDENIRQVADEFGTVTRELLDRADADFRQLTDNHPKGRL
jgi:hypothetical protein